MAVTLGNPAQLVKSLARRLTGVPRLLAFVAFVLAASFGSKPGFASGRSFRVIVAEYTPRDCPGCTSAVDGLRLALEVLHKAMPSIGFDVVRGQGARCPAHGTFQENTFAIVTGIWPEIRGEKNMLGMELQFIAGGRRVSSAGLTWDAVSVADSLGVATGADFCAQVIAHEILHSFGLGHSTDSSSIMYQWLKPGGRMVDRLPELRSFESAVSDSLSVWESRASDTLQK